MTENERVQCPYCRELILAGAVKCKECGSILGRLPRTSGSKEWVRNLPERKFFGVSAAIAKNYHVSVTLVRLIFILLTFLHLLGLAIYLILVAIIPYEAGKRSLFETAVDAISAALESARTRPSVASGAVSTEATVATAPPPVPAVTATQTKTDAAPGPSHTI